MYRTHGDKRGVSNSQQKLRSLRLPGKLTGKSVLDLGWKISPYFNACSPSTISALQQARLITLLRSL